MCMYIYLHIYIYMYIYIMRTYIHIYVCMHVSVPSRFSCVQFFVTLQTVACQALLSMELSN